MPKFTWTAKDASGNDIVREITAPNVEASKQVLLSEGCTELVLREDEIMHAARDRFTEKSTIFGEEIKVTTEERLKHLNQPRKTMFRRVIDTIIQDMALYGCVLAVIGFEIWRGRTEIAIGFGCAMLCWPVFRIWMTLPGYYYKKLNQAKDWHRWQEVMELVEKSESIRRTHVIKLPQSELLRARAQALAGMGNMQQALVIMQGLVGQPGMPSWLHTAHIAGLYDIAKQHDTAIEYNRKAIAEHSSPVLWADLMNRYLRYKRDPVNARAALAEVEKGTLTETARPYVIRCRGILAYFEGDDATAKKELEAALAILEPTKDKPFREGAMCVAYAYLCCVLARQGDLEGAKKFFAKAKPYLVATGEKDLLAECTQAMS